MAVAKVKNVLIEVLDAYRPEIISQLETSTLFLTYLARYNLIDPKDILKFEQNSKQERNTLLVDAVLENGKNEVLGYSRFMEALRKSDQASLASLLTNVDTELLTIIQYQSVLEKHLDEMNMYLKTESRRAEVHFDPQKTDITTPNETLKIQLKTSTAVDRENMAGFLFQVYSTTKSTIHHFDQCRDVINKLHDDCEVVAKSNSELLHKMREIEQAIRFTLNPSAVADDNLQSPRSDHTFSHDRKTESELILRTIKQQLDEHIVQLQTIENDRGMCMKVMGNIIHDIEKRKDILSKISQPLPYVGIQNKYMNDMSDSNPSHDRKNANPSHTTVIATLPPLVKKLGLVNKMTRLANEMQDYVHQETQVTQKLYLKSGLVHRDFDAVDRDLVRLQKEIKGDNREKTVTLVNQVVDMTRGERKDCLRIIDEAERIVKNRKHYLVEMGEKPKLKTKGKSRPKLIHSLETNFSKRLHQLSTEIESYIEMEVNLAKKSKSDDLQKNKDLDAKMKEKNTKIRGLEKQIHLLERQKNHAPKGAEVTKALLTKAVIPTRNKRFGSFLDQAGESRKIARPVPRNTKNNAAKNIAKPRVLARSQSLEKLKENVKERKTNKSKEKLPPINEMGNSVGFFITDPE